MMNDLPQENITWNSPIKGFFRPSDIECMKGRGIFLDDYDSVKADVEIIYNALSEGYMPPDAPWTKEKIDTFRKWKDNGCPLD